MGARLDAIEERVERIEALASVLVVYSKRARTGTACREPRGRGVSCIMRLMVGGDHDVPKLTLRSGLLRTLGLDLVGPLLVFQVCRRAGVAEVWSLVIAGVLPAIAVVVDWMQFRTVQVLGIVVLGGLALAVVLALISDDPKTVLLEGAIVTAAFGVACLVSLVVGRRPLIF